MHDDRKEWFKGMAYIDGTPVEELDNQNASLEVKLAKAITFTIQVFRYARKRGDGDLAEQARATLTELAREE